jgi:hypothetical protein
MVTLAGLTPHTSHILVAILTPSPELPILTTRHLRIYPGQAPGHTRQRFCSTLPVAPEELQGSLAAMEEPRPLSMGWARGSEESEFERGLEGASLESLDSLSRELDAEQERLQRFYGEFPEASEQGRFIKRQIREVAGQSGSVKTSAMVRRNQREAKLEDEHDMDTESSDQEKIADQRDKSP